MILEKATGDDLNHICSLDAAVIEGSGRRGFLTEAIGASQCWVAKKDGVINAFAVLERSFYGHAFVSLVMVHPEHRRCGGCDRSHPAHRVNLFEREAFYLYKPLQRRHATGT
ncbi:hypothetical protein BH23ACT11_BH23ACT11_14730 [soil metagenome]